MSLSALRSVLFALSLLTGSAMSLRAQAAPPPAGKDPLFQTISSLDTALFDAANRCDLDKLGTYFTDDLEFYHDKTGLAVGKQDFLQKTKNNLCDKVRRELVPGSLEVYPLKGYGAVEIGVHRFHHPGHDDTMGVGEAKFIHVWQYKDGAWKISRVISYDHH
ncbi:MAG: hypothetical protein JWP98_1426 [Edaphobacter sp.]|nr:hypothetical protein [Edaphobacter sp.]